MISKIIYRLVPIIVGINYSLISLRIQINNLFANKLDQNDIEKLYEEYIRKVRNKEIFPQREYNSNQIFIDYRNSVNGKLSTEDEEYLLKALKGRSSRWFVPHVLNLMDSFSEKLMIQLIETAIKIKDPSYNSSFVTPAKRVYDLEVNDYLVKRFSGSTDKDKEGILRLFYWVRSRLSTSFLPDGTEEQNYWINYIWKGTKYKYIECTDKQEYELYKRKVSQKYDERTELLLYEYFKSSKKKMKDSISWYLPKEINDYPERLLIKATRYLEENESSV